MNNIREVFGIGDPTVVVSIVPAGTGSAVNIDVGQIRELQNWLNVFLKENSPPKKSGEPK